MKKIILSSLAAIAAVSAACYANLNPEKEVSQLTLDNVEALSTGESLNTLYSWPCSHGGGSQCIHSVSQITCSTLHYC